MVRAISIGFHPGVFIVKIVARYLMFQQSLVEFVSRAPLQVKCGKIIHVLRSVVENVRARLREVFD